MTRLPPRGFEIIDVIAEAGHGVTDHDLLAAFSRAGVLTAIAESKYRFDWRPVVAAFPEAADEAEPSDFQSELTYAGTTWTWAFDSYPLTTGRILWRIANASRMLSILSVLVDRAFLNEWLAQSGTIVLAAQAKDCRRAVPLITEDFAELVAGPLGNEVFKALRYTYAEAAAQQDEATYQSERRSSLIASFVRDQLAVRPPISEDEIAMLKRRLGLP